MISRHASKRCSAAPKIDERGGLRRGGGLVAWNRSETASSDVNEHRVRKKAKKKQRKEIFSFK